MDIQSYIASGKLELFVLGELSDREREEVIALSQQYPEIRKELDEIEASMFAFDDSSGTRPSPDVKRRIFDDLKDELKEPLVEARSETKVVSIQPWKTFAVAASVVALMAIGAAVYFAVKFYDVEERFTAILQERNILSEELEVNQVKYGQLSGQMENLLSGDFKRVQMSGTPFEIQKNAKVDVFWDAQSQEVFVSVNQLAELSDEQDYQLWAIGDDGPVGIGIVKAGQKLTLQQMEAVNSAGKFAITIEPKGGSKAPTLENLVVIGDVT